MRQPWTVGESEVNVDMCDGSVVGAWQMAQSNFRPSAASLSIAGEVSRPYP